MKIAVIGSTGFASLGNEKKISTHTLETDEGRVEYDLFDYLGTRVLFVRRSNVNWPVAAHNLNPRRTLKGLKAVGVTHIIATCAVGAINNLIDVGDYVIVDQFLDFSRGACQHTFFDGDVFANVDITSPFCPRIRTALHSSISIEPDLRYHSSGCYVNVSGPRYETAAEIRMFRIVGGDIVGMTIVPEAIMARESGICYAAVCFVTNKGAGMMPQQVVRQHLYDVRAESGERTRSMVLHAIEVLRQMEDTKCDCAATSSDFQGPALP